MLYEQLQLQRLKVNDLRAICKEVNLAKTSKDAKAILIDKILGVASLSTTKERTDPLVKAQTFPLAPDKVPKIIKRSLSPRSSSGHSAKTARFQLSRLYPATDRNFAEDPTPLPGSATSRIASAKASESVHPPKSTPATNGVAAITVNTSFPTNPSPSGWLLRDGEISKPGQTRLGSRFQPPIRVAIKADIPKLRTSLLAASRFGFDELEHLDSSIEARIRYIRSSFMEELFRNLKTNRQTAPLKVIPSSSTTIPQFSGEYLTFPGLNPNIYATSETTQFTVSVRFWLFRLYVNLQMGAGEDWAANAHGLGRLGPDLERWPVVISCDRVTTDLWLVQTSQSEDNTGLPLTTKYDGSERGESELFLVLAMTGEVLGRGSLAASICAGSDRPTLASCDVRADWVTYIQASPGVGSPPIGTFVKTKNDHAYPSGVSRLWRERTDDKVLSSIAARAAISSCSPQSFSGPKASAVQMDAACLGNVSSGATTRVHQRVELYLPEAMQVESVHVPKAPFHLALAIVHRQAGLSDYILRETGQIVGNETHGVAELWQGVLGCDSKGNVAAKPEFWSGWYERVYA